MADASVTMIHDPSELCEIQNKGEVHTLLQSLRREFPLVPGEGISAGLRCSRRIRYTNSRAHRLTGPFHAQKPGQSTPPWSGCLTIVNISIDYRNCAEQNLRVTAPMDLSEPHVIQAISLVKRSTLQACPKRASSGRLLLFVVVGASDSLFHFNSLKVRRVPNKNIPCGRGNLPRPSMRLGWSTRLTSLPNSPRAPQGSPRLSKALPRLLKRMLRCLSRSRTKQKRIPSRCPPGTLACPVKRKFRAVQVAAAVIAEAFFFPQSFSPCSLFPAILARLNCIHLWETVAPIHPNRTK